MVTLVNKLTVTGDTGEFTRILEKLTEFMRAQPGYLSSELLRSVRNPQIYLEVARWETAGAHRAAVTSDGFRERVAGLGALATVDPDVYEILHENVGTAGR
ncbi:antibiotic biosynthesis monooxygenase [Amycolatopsis acidicola]|uniref:Antibiotic biosynthesis monooxygenase n=1 Tax=Amycolatopsis acidicola TaxID=2596893 RepID=A0A5N0VLB9_9PSEU|nr:antibiotic biosynthesis monooxygenase family protein [Amycolatopsis acidicola]KAA9166518.1 antibiotic biosynthesis monooxygenase [Amycolatopsis acidicola]